ncbi:hypothetical protein [Methyloversatilis thermotolerans]|uniref:hypothetical protein n=1 Tax=Methyloversatilis thermotolerans TaxID=1346290 RepID=UPI0012F78514|nr:hypothetical protein [Methyloversatilis thermotolerans]
MDHKQRFMGWRKRMPEKTRYLVDRVLERVVPEFERHGFVWNPEFQAGANVLPLQKSEGENWPTVELIFIPTGPFFKINFSALPVFCQSPQEQDIPRSRAGVIAGPLSMTLHRGVWEDQKDSEFGFNFLPLLFFSPVRFMRYQFDWRKFLNSEVDAAAALLPYLFDIFDKKTYIEWMDHPFGSINKHVFLSMSWKIRLDMESARSNENLTKDGEAEIPQEAFLCALDAETDSVNKIRDNKLLAAILLVVVGLYFGEQLIRNHEWLGIILVLFCMGFIAYTIFRTAQDKQNVAVKYGLRCTRCGHIPAAQMMASAATSRRCAKCGARLATKIPSENAK